MDMSLPECAAQLGAAMLTIQQTVSTLDNLKIIFGALGFAIGIVVCSMFYEWRYRQTISFQRWLAHGLLPADSTLAKSRSIAGKLCRWSGRVERFATKKRGLKL